MIAKWDKCPSCNGKGYIFSQFPVFHGQMNNSMVVCESCRGTDSIKKDQTLEERVARLEEIVEGWTK